MTKAILAALFVSVVPLAAAADPTHGIEYGFPFSNLEIDPGLTEARGGGTTESPHLMLSAPESTSPIWPEVGVIATPKTGVCGVGAYGVPRSVRGADMTSLTKSVISADLGRLAQEVGPFVFKDGPAYAADADAERIAESLERDGNVTYSSIAEKVPGAIYAEFNLELSDGVVQPSYYILYENVENCMNEIHGSE